jgi:hypothetical protein
MNYNNLSNKLTPEALRINKIAFFDEVVKDEGLDTHEKRIDYSKKLFEIMDMNNTERAEYIIDNELTKTEKMYIVSLLQSADTKFYIAFIQLAIDSFYHFTMETK